MLLVRLIPLVLQGLLPGLPLFFFFGGGSPKLCWAEKLPGFVVYYTSTPLGSVCVVDFSTSYPWLVRQNHEEWELWPGGGMLHIFIYDQMWDGSITFKRKWFVLLIRLFTHSYSDLTPALPTAFSSHCCGFMVCWLTDMHLLHY